MGHEIAILKATEFSKVEELHTYKDRPLVKPVKAAVRYMPKAEYAPPYVGAKKMLLVENMDIREYLMGLFEAMELEIFTSEPLEFAGVENVYRSTYIRLIDRTNFIFTPPDIPVYPLCPF